MLGHRRHSVRFPLILAVSLALLAAWGLPANSSAEEAADSPLKAGAWAAEFELDPTLNYGFGYTGSATVAMKRHGSPSRAIRFGVNYRFSEEKGRGPSGQALYYPPYYPLPVVVEGELQRISESHSYALFVHMVRERPVRDRVAIFGEFGPSFRFSEYDSYSESLYGLSSPYRVTYDESVVERSVALDLNLGFEWFFSKRLSLGARYGTFAAYEWGSRHSSYTSVDLTTPAYSSNWERRETNRVEVGTTRTSLTLAAYF